MREAMQTGAQLAGGPGLSEKGRAGGRQNSDRRMAMGEGQVMGDGCR